MNEHNQTETDSEGRSSQLLALLTERRERLAARIRQALRERQEESQMRDAPGSHGWAAAPEGNISLAMVAQQQQQLQQIDAAIQRTKAGTYGRCAGCGEEIPLARLQALPFAQRCAACQEEWEAEKR
ncbi:TraR/DksA family transcriptional regulator [Candidatus Methylomirabilis sp.]|uniref:TraR/DksA family transcriptional regulator n=1 Tax=Candidatus Methylomirabilis sp. TaxID=2032687 RepID=UPI002A5C83AB|nr:TraR/DksA family transcriptional regulator [Candidatus Methylomirabilis sp.]